jgi:hypothetical protein
MSLTDTLPVSVQTRTVQTRHDVVAVFVFLLSAFWLSSTGFDASEAVFHYDVARQIVRTGQLGFDESREGIFYTAPNGRTYGSHEFGNTLPLIATAAVNRLVEVVTKGRIPPHFTERVEQFPLSFQAGLYAAMTLTIVYLILTIEFGHSTRSAFLACLALGFCTFFWNYSRLLFDGLLCGLLTVASVAALLRYRHSLRDRDLFIAIALLGYGVDTRLSMVLFIAATVVFIGVGCGGSRVRQIGIAGAALLPFALWQMWYNQLRTGNALLSPVQTPIYVENNGLHGDLTTGIIGLLASPGKGIVVYAPLFVPAILVFPRFLRRDRALASYIAVSAGLWLLLHGKLNSWYGAWGWGPRHMITILPLLCLPALIEWDVLMSRTWTKVVTGVALIAGFLIATAATIGNYHYRLELAARENRIDDPIFVWGGLDHSWNGTQALDMLCGAWRNLQVVAGRLPPLIIAEASPSNVYASNGFNMWWYVLPHVGVPTSAVAAVCSLLLITIIACGIRLLRRWPA